MKKVSSIVGLPVLAAAEAELFGTAAAVVFDKRLKKMVGIRAALTDDGGQEYGFIARQKLFFGKDALIAADKTFLESADSPTAECALGALVWTVSGAVLGKLLDIELDGADVAALYYENGCFTPADIFSFSNNCVLLKDGEKPPIKRKGTLRPNAGGVKKNFDLKKPAEQTADSPQKKLPARVPPHRTRVTRTPQESGAVTTGYDFLLNKTLSRDIFCENGNLLVKKGAVVDNEILKTVKQHGKMVQLALYTD